MGTLVQFPRLPELKLREAVGGNGQGVITAWLSSFPGGARAKLRIRITNLRRVPRVEWTKKQWRYLEAGISEIKWSYIKKEFRIAGFDSGGNFVMVVGFTHKQGVYDPPGWLHTAKRTKAEVERDDRGTIDFEP